MSDIQKIIHVGRVVIVVAVFDFALILGIVSILS